MLPVTIFGFLASLNKKVKLRIDAVTHAMTTITYFHKEIHAGEHYFVAGHTALAEDAKLDFIVTTPNTAKHAHMFFSLKSTASMTFEVREAIAEDNDGVSVTPINNNRNSANTSALVIKTNGTITELGTLIESFKVGTAGVANFQKSGAGERESEIILKQNTKYLFRILSNADANIISYRGEWYEHTALN